VDRYLYTDNHAAIISDELFAEAQREKLRRSKSPEQGLSMTQIF